MSVSFEEISRDSAFYTKALALRYDLFFRDLNLPRDILLDADESLSRHFILKDDTVLTAYGRAVQSGESVRFSQMIVHPEFQRRGFGTILLKSMSDICEQVHAKEIRVSARLTAVDFYAKSGFTPVGEIYKSSKTRIDHIEMVKKI